MSATWIVAALVAGFAAWRIGLPPLVGFLVAGFALGAFGAEPTPVLSTLSEAGVLLLLFAVGLKVRLKTLLRHEVWGSALAHLVLFGVIAFALFATLGRFALPAAITLALALGFSSTVFAGKELESARELRAVHGRVAIGILIVQDLAAVALLAALNTRAPSPYALVVLGLPLLRPLLARSLDWVGHGELLVLFGAALALAIGGEAFARLGLSPELGALLLGMTLSDHRRAQELSDALWSLKELFLVGFFLSIGLSQTPTWAEAGTAGLVMLLLPLKGAGFFALLLAFGLRARTSLLTALSLLTFSEFGLIVVQTAVADGILPQRWLVVAAVTVALSFVLAAPLNAYAHSIYRKTSRWLDRLERDKRHPDDEPITLGRAEILIVGMGRVGTGAFEYLRRHRDNIVGVDSDPGKLERHLHEGRRVAYADAEDPSFWQLLNLDRIQAILLAIPDLHAKLLACRELRARGFRGLISATHVFPEELAPILAAGCDVSYNYFNEAGVGFARHTWEALNAPADAEEIALQG
jgi:predicted Kef-type K+ transport protein